MFEASKIMFIYCVSPVHMGAGQAIGVIDNPIQRERHTNHPNMAGSGLKGALRHHLEAAWGDKPLVARLFGPETDASDFAGAVSFGDAQLVAFPVRSLRQAFVYAVSPVGLARLKRLAEIGGAKVEWTVPEPVPDGALVADDRVLNDARLVLEAFEFAAEKPPEIRSIAKWLARNALPADDANAYFRGKIEKDLVLLPDGAFSHFVENATVVEPHVRIDDDSGTAADGGLFYTENLPPESLLAAPVFASIERVPRSGGREERKSAAEIMTLLADGPEGTRGLDGALLQIGGDATTGRGQVLLHFT